MADSGEDELVFPHESPSLNSRKNLRSNSHVKILKAVEVPQKPSMKSMAAVSKAFMQSPETVSLSSSSSHREMSNDYETPATSVAVTPAEFAIDASGKLSSIRCLPLTEAAKRNTVESPVNMLKGKRKRIAVDDDLEADRRMAQALQAEEYGETLLMNATTSRKKTRVADSDEDEMSLTDPPSDIDMDPPSEEESVVIDRRALKKIKTKATSSLPTRKARDNARTSIAQKASLGIMDSDDDDDEESEYLSEADSDILSDAETLDSIMNSNDIGNAAAITAAPDTLPATSNFATRRQRRVGTASRRERTRPWEDRVIFHTPIFLTDLLMLALGY